MLGDVLLCRVHKIGSVHCLGAAAAEHDHGQPQENQRRPPWLRHHDDDSVRKEEARVVEQAHAAQAGQIQIPEQAAFTETAAAAVEAVGIDVAPVQQIEDIPKYRRIIGAAIVGEANQAPAVHGEVTRDDHAIVAAKVLRHNAFEVLITDSMSLARSIIMLRRFDVVVADINIDKRKGPKPTDSGLAFARFIRERSDTHVILWGASSGHFQAAAAVGAMYVTKSKKIADGLGAARLGDALRVGKGTV